MCAKLLQYNRNTPQFMKYLPTTIVKETVIFIENVLPEKNITTLSKQGTEIHQKPPPWCSDKPQPKTDNN